LQLPEVVDLGRIPFAAAHERMRVILERVRGGGKGEILLAEHEPVYTAGRATPPAERVDGAVGIERGGRVTYHGPGQLVVYPVVPLPRRDVRAWLRALERFGIGVCAQLGVTAATHPDGTGVFTGGRKVASIGVAVRHWVNLHGIAFNVAMDLAPFFAVRPCGFDPAVMTDLSREAGRPITLDEAKAAVRERFFLLLDPASWC
jgi:lipoyl(octanoyl) transferase